MPTEIWCALIAGVVTLVTTLATLQVTMRKDRDKQRDDIKAELIKYHEKNREEILDIRQNDLRNLRDDVTSMAANLQQKIAVIELELGHTRNDITTLSTRVEKHNNVIERVYSLETKAAVFEEKMKVANHRLDDLEKGAAHV